MLPRDQVNDCPEFGALRGAAARMAEIYGGLVQKVRRGYRFVLATDSDNQMTAPLLLHVEDAALVARPPVLVRPGGYARAMSAAELVATAALPPPPPPPAWVLQLPRAAMETRRSAETRMSRAATRELGFLAGVRAGVKAARQEEAELQLQLQLLRMASPPASADGEAEVCTICLGAVPSVAAERWVMPCRVHAVCRECGAGWAAACQRGAPAGTSAVDAVTCPTCRRAAGAAT